MHDAALLPGLEAISRERPDRVLRLMGSVPSEADPSRREPCELLIFRGFSCSTTHPTAFDPDQSVLPEGVELSGAELLAAPLNPAAEQRLMGPCAVDTFLQPDAWG